MVAPKKKVGVKKSGMYAKPLPGLPKGTVPGREHPIRQAPSPTRRKRK